MADLQQLISALQAKNRTLSTAESCTGGILGEQITAVSGASSVYKGGIISYCNEVKHSLLGVSQVDLDTLGAVSAPVAQQMAEGARKALQTDFALSVTGLAGPNGDGSGKPVGLVYIGCASAHETVVAEYHFSGSRDAVREQAAHAAWELLLKALG